MKGYEMSEKKKAIIEATWEYLLGTGLANASIGDLCREAKLAQSSLYYWFENKDDIWISAGKYGLSKVVDALDDIYELPFFTINILIQEQADKLVSSCIVPKCVVCCRLWDNNVRNFLYHIQNVLFCVCPVVF